MLTKVLEKLCRGLCHPKQNGI